MKKLFRLNNKGFSHIEIGLVVVVVLVLGLAGYAVLKNTSHAGGSCSGMTFKYDVSHSYNCVKDFQNMYGLSADGLLGPDTQSVIKTAQFEFKLSQTGVLDPNLWSKICNVVPENDSATGQAAQKDACGKVISAPAKLTVQQTLWNQYANWTNLPMEANNVNDGNGGISYDTQYFQVKACKITHKHSSNGNVGTPYYWDIHFAAQIVDGKKLSDFSFPVNFNGFWHRTGGSETPKTDFGVYNWNNNVATNFGTSIPTQTYDLKDAGDYVSTNNAQPNQIEIHAQIEMPNTYPNNGYYVVHDNTNSVTLDKVAECN